MRSDLRDQVNGSRPTSARFTRNSTQIGKQDHHCKQSSHLLLQDDHHVASIACATVPTHMLSAAENG